MNTENKRRVMVLGFDGASFNVINTLIGKGKLPLFALMIKEGVSGNLRSTIPPLSGPAWAAFATGKLPGKHGIFDFFRNLPEDYSCTPINSTFLPTKTFWEILSENGKKVGVTNMLFTYPPTEVNGYIVSGRETPSEDVEYSYPKSIKDEVLSCEPNFKVEPFRQISRTKHFLRHVVRQLKVQEKACSYLIKKYPCDFTMSFFAIPDIIQHIFWPCIDSSHPNFRAEEARKFLLLIEECYKTLDWIIGERLKMMNENTTLIIMSDHGAGGANRIFQVNKWLQNEGLMAIHEKYRNKGAVEIFRKLFRNILNTVSMIDIFGLRRLIGLKTREKRRNFARKTVVDWSRTKAYSGRIGEYGIHINLKGREGKGIVDAGEEYEKVRDFIIKGLSELKTPENNKRIFKKIWKREELYSGDFVKYAPDLIFDFGDHPCLPGDSLLAKDVFEDIPAKGLAGMHRDNGIILAKGKHIKSGVTVEGAHICDLAPTILFLLGAKVPEDMDGKVLLDILSSSQSKEKINYSRISVSSEKAKFVFTGKEQEEISKRLGDLGYL